MRISSVAFFYSFIMSLTLILCQFHIHNIYIYLKIIKTFATHRLPGTFHVFLYISYFNFLLISIPFSTWLLICIHPLRITALLEFVYLQYGKYQSFQSPIILVLLCLLLMVYFCRLKIFTLCFFFIYSFSDL